eukprot:483692_1
MELTRYNSYISGLDCSPISQFDEKEVLFFGGDSIFYINSIHQWYNKKWRSYRKYIVEIQCLMDIAHGIITWERINNIKNVIGYILPHLYTDNKSLPPYITKLLNYHLKNVPAKIEYDFRELCDQYQWVKNIFVTDNASEATPNVANAC